MRAVLVIIFILLLLFLQVGVFPHLRIMGVFPNLIALAILGTTLLQGWKKTLPWMIAGGLFLDFYSLHNILGISVIGLLIGSYLADFLSQNIFKKANIQSLLLIFSITIFLYGVLLMIFFKIFGVASAITFSGFFIGIIYNLIFSLPIFYGLKKIQSKKKI